MAVTDIQATVLRITGVTPTANSVEDAQRFVVSSVPKNLLHFAQKASSASTDGSAISFSVNDSITDVQRNGYSCREIPMSEGIWALDSTSLKYATAKHPVWFHKQGAVHFAPATDGSNAGYVFYVDYSLIDDNSDLRNAVINYASSKEFSKLSNDEFPTISITAVPPDVPSLSEITFSTATAPSNPSDPTISSPGLATVAKADISGDVPTYTKPTITTRVSFNDFFESGSLNPFDDSDPSALSISAVPPDSPSLGTTTMSITGTAPTYTEPTLPGDATNITDLSSLDVDNTIDTLADQIEVDQWFATAAHLIEDEEDTELAAMQLQKISTYLQAYSAAVQNQLNKFNDANVEFQANLQKDIKNAEIDNQEDARLLQKYQAELSVYQAEVGSEVQEYTQKLQRYTSELNNAYQAWAKTESDSLQIFQLDIQNELNEFNKENARYQANVQASIAKFQVDATEAQKEGDLTFQASIQDYVQELALFSGEIQNYQAQVQENVQDMQSVVANNQSLISKFQAETSEYQAEVQSEVAEYQNKLAKQKSYSQEADLYYKWAQSEINSYIQNNSKTIGMKIATGQAQNQQRAS